MMRLPVHMPLDHDRIGCCRWLTLGTITGVKKSLKECPMVVER
ncbi:MAG: hypothetical protein ACR2PL_14775 [Dehalococcoidia bacterium]